LNLLDSAAKHTRLSPTFENDGEPSTKVAPVIDPAALADVPDVATEVAIPPD
jgi:hypothetical protein